MISGVCYICGAPAFHTCSICGRMVCDAHYVPELGACTECAGGMKADKVYKKHTF